jgi:hypothetical protein
MAGNGCLKDTLAGVGCLTLLVIGGALGWHYRGQIAGLYHSFRGDRRGAETPPAASAPATGRPTAEALEAARAKWDEMARQDGPAYVRLTPGELAALITQGLGAPGRAALDSIEVTLAEDRFTLRANLKMDLVGKGLLGPLAGAFGPREPVSVSGPARVGAVGAVAWEPDSFVIRSFPLPQSAVPALVNRLTGRPDGVVPIRVPSTVGDLHIRPDGVTFYRRTPEAGHGA